MTSPPAESAAPLAMPIRPARPPMSAARLALWPLLMALLLAVTLAAATLGAPVPLSDLWSADSSRAAIAHAIFWDIRAPRVLAALLVGAALAVSGSGLQSLFGNPLAEPYLLGISAGGALGATVAAALNLPTFTAPLFHTPVESGAGLAFIGALGAAALVYRLGQGPSSLYQLGAGHDRARLLLTGVALSAFLTAIMSLVITLSGRIELAQQATFWLLGGLTRATWGQDTVLLVALAVGLALSLGSARDLNALRAGEEEAATLGVNSRRLRARLLVATSLMAAASVAAAGLIGFIGLLAPHLVRMAGARDARLLLPGSALCGATLLCACDALARSIHPPVEIPVGILTALLGVPLFLGLARRG